MGFVVVVGLVGEFVDLVIIVSLLGGLVGIPGFRNQEERVSVKQEAGLWRQLTSQRQQHQQQGDENRVHIPNGMLSMTDVGSSAVSQHLSETRRVWWPRTALSDC